MKKFDAAAALSQLEQVADQVAVSVATPDEVKGLAKACEALAARFDKASNTILTVYGTSVNHLANGLIDFAALLAPAPQLDWKTDDILSKIDTMRSLKQVGLLDDDEVSRFDSVMARFGTTKSRKRHSSSDMASVSSVNVAKTVAVTDAEGKVWHPAMKGNATGSPGNLARTIAKDYQVDTKSDEYKTILALANRACQGETVTYQGFTLTPTL